MKFQNPSLKCFLRDGRHTDKLKPICSLLFQSWGIKMISLPRKPPAGGMAADPQSFCGGIHR